MLKPVVVDFPVGLEQLLALCAQIIPIILKVSYTIDQSALIVLTIGSAWTPYMTEIAKLIAQNQITNGGPSKFRRIGFHPMYTSQSCG